jgi:hypothetical protein
LAALRRQFIICLSVFAASAGLAHSAENAGAARSGRPDLEGYWSNATITAQARPSNFGGRATLTPAEVKAFEDASRREIERGNAPTDPGADVARDGTVGGYNRAFIDPGTEVMRVRGEPRTSLIATSDGLPPKPKLGHEYDPMELMAATSMKGYRLDEFGSPAGIDEGGLAKDSYNNPEDLSLGERCLTSFGRNGPPPMFANGFYNNNYQIVQTPQAVLIVVEMVHDQRIIRLNTRRHLPSQVRPWFGDSVGWYEGGTLVVETTNLPKTQAYFGSWEHLKVTERFTRVAKDRLLYQFTVEDPSVWEAPWGGEYEFGTIRGPIYEYACHEGNYAAPGILAGSREAERRASTATGRAP